MMRPPVETQIVSIVPPVHPRLFPFFLRFSFPFCRSPFSPSFSFCRFPFVSCITFAFRFPALLGGGFCSFVSVLHPPCAAREPASLRIPFVCCLISFLVFLIFIYFIFLLFFFFSILIWTSFVSSCLFLVGNIYAVSSVSVSVVCVLHKNLSFYPSASSTPSVRAHSSS